MGSRPRFAVRLLALPVLMVACSGSEGARPTDPLGMVGARPATTEPWSEFCGGAIDLVEYLDVNTVALFDPATAADFLAGAESRLAALEASAPEGVKADVSALHAAYADLERLLAAAGYDLARVDGEALLAQIDTGASLTLDGYLLSDCGYGAAPAGRAPSVLSEQELAELLADGPDREGVADDPDRLLSALLGEGSGWSSADVDCVLSGLSAATKDELIDGGLDDGDVSPAAAAELARSLDDCGIDESGS